MKKYICLITVAVLLFSGILPVFADDQLFIPSSDMDSELTAILNAQLGEEEYALLNNKEKYKEDIKDISLDGKRIIPFYKDLYLHLIPASLNDLIAQGKSEERMDYLILGEECIRLRKWVNRWDTDILFVKSPDPLNATYAKDIANLSVQTEILGKQCQISQIIGFDSAYDYLGTSIYVVTDQGTFVRYYPDYISEGVWFTEQDYQTYAQAYYQYITSYEHNYDENGEPLNGTSISLLDYINTLYPYQGSGNPQKPEKGLSNKQIVAIVSSAAAVAAISVSVGVIVFRKKRKNKSTESKESQ